MEDPGGYQGPSREEEMMMNGDPNDGDAALAMDEDMMGDLSELPLFANDEAKLVFAQIEEQRGILERAAGEHAEHSERLGVMREHLKNVSQEVTHTMHLASAKTAEIKSESHGRELSKREAGRYKQELKREQTELEEHDAQLQVLQNAVFEANEKMDKFKLEMNWNQEELEQWAVAAKQKEDDDMALQRYTRADDVKIAALTLQIEKLTKVDLQRKVQHENERTETQARQIELERTAEEFRALHAERQRLLAQWKDALEAAKRRDKDIAQVAENYVEERKIKQAKDADLTEARDRLKRQQDENADLESRTLIMERQVQARREDVAAEKEKLQRLGDEIDVLKSELASSARTVIRLRKENERAAEEVASRKAHLEKCRKMYHASKQVYEDEVTGNRGVENEATRAEEELRDAENAKKRKLRDLEALKQQMFKHSQQLFTLRQEEANYIAEISGAQAQRRNLQAKIRHLDAESTRQQELVYNAEFQIQQMERKVARGLGERSDDEKRVLTAQIAKINEDLDAHKDRKKMLANQARRLANELRAAQRANEVANEEERRDAEKITELDLENTAADQSLQQRKVAEEEAMVQNDIMRLELKRLRDALSERADVVFTLENRKQQLALSMAERKKEIAVHRDVQQAQLRLANDEKHAAHIELGKRKQHVTKLEAKYETLCKSSRLRADDGGDGGDGGEGGEPRSQAYYMIQAAQKREELQRKGDELDQEIRRREREMRALEATLAHVNGRNTAYRESFKKADPKSAEADDLAQLQEQEKLAKDALFRRKKALQRLATDHEEDSRRLNQVDAQCDRLRERNGHLREAKAQMDLELEAHDLALDKLHKRLDRLSKMHREKVHAQGGAIENLGLDEETLQEKLFRANALQESNVAVLATINELAKAYPEISQNLQGLLNNLRLAHKGHQQAPSPQLN